MQKGPLHSCRAQSLVEYAVVLGLVCLLAVTVARGIGRQTAARMAVARDAFQDGSVARELPPLPSAAVNRSHSTTNGVTGQ